MHFVYVFVQTYHVFFRSPLSFLFSERLFDTSVFGSNFDSFYVKQNCFPDASLTSRRKASTTRLCSSLMRYSSRVFSTATSKDLLGCVRSKKRDLWTSFFFHSLGVSFSGSAGAPLPFRLQQERVRSRAVFIRWSV